jgi:hypothetical protein
MSRNEVDEASCIVSIISISIQNANIENENPKLLRGVCVV